MQDRAREALRRTPLFLNLSPEELDRIVRIGSPRRIAKRQPIFRQGDRADGFFVVASGRVKVFKLSEEGKEQVLHLLDPGQSFAEAVLFEGGTYPANAEAIEETELFFFPKRPFIELLEKNPKMTLRMLGSLAKWLRRMTDLVEDLALRDVESRLVLYLAEGMRQRGIPMEDGAEFELPVGKNVLASRLGTVPETFSRTLRKLQEQGTIRVTGKRIRVLSADRLFVPSPE